ncbi:MAG: tetratricopeptide repeat protein [Alphaproteobacteria bacterium]|jgi:hypothetical protein|nr:tetratricopeptide repeat protein [Alphaproteobacteria bacterium]MBR1756421.1 tetratricopeptide repeat protein [Alphaproteobacteria bacterium]
MAKNTTKSSAKKTADVKLASVKTRRISKDTSQVNPEYTDAFINEVNEDVKNDNFKVLWNRYGIFVILFVVLAVSATVSFERIKSWKVAQNQANTENYMVAAQLRDNPTQTLEALQKIAGDNQGIFSDFAKLQIANVLFSQDKTEEALATLQNLLDDNTVNNEVKHIALVKLATYRVDTMPRAEFEAMLKPLIAENTSWSPLAQDLLAMAAIRDGDVDTAQTIYENILKIKDLPENFRTKVQDMLNSLSDM